MKLLSLVLVLILILFTTGTLAGPGYVSRNCKAWSIKEAITLDWSDTKHWFKARLVVYTDEFVVKKNYYNGIPFPLFNFPSGNDPQPRQNSWWESPKVNAGMYYDADEYRLYRPLITGLHHWYNKDARRVESRSESHDECKALYDYGYNNW